MYVRIDSMNIWKNRKLQYQNIWTNDLEDGMATLGMTLDLSPGQRATFDILTGGGLGAVNDPSEITAVKYLLCF